MLKISLPRLSKWSDAARMVADKKGTKDKLLADYQRLVEKVSMYRCRSEITVVKSTYNIAAMSRQSRGCEF